MFAMYVPATWEGQKKTAESDLKLWIAMSYYVAVQYWSICPLHGWQMHLVNKPSLQLWELSQREKNIGNYKDFSISTLVFI